MSNIFEFKQKDKSKKEDDSSYELSLAKQMIQSDKQLSGNIEKLGIDKTQAAKWIVWLSDMIREIDEVVLKYTDKAEDDKKFSVLAVKALTASLTSQIAFIGSLQDIELEQFEAMKQDVIADVFLTTYAGMDVQDYLDKLDIQTVLETDKEGENQNV
jgi:hypothetical protein